MRCNILDKIIDQFDIMLVRSVQRTLVPYLDKYGLVAEGISADQFLHGKYFHPISTVHSAYPIYIVCY